MGIQGVLVYRGILCVFIGITGYTRVYIGIRESSWVYMDLSNAIENTANQEARNPVHILRYETSSIPRKNPDVPCNLTNSLSMSFH